METLTERCLIFLIGVIVGYTLARLDRIKQEVDEIDDMMKHNRDDRGIYRLRPVLQDLILLGVLVMVAASAFSVSRTNDEVLDQQQRISRITECNQKFLSKTIAALNERTVFTVEQTRANVAVQQAQADFFLGLYENPTDDELELRLAKRYGDRLTEFVTESKKLGSSIEDFPYATPGELQRCLNN